MTPVEHYLKAEKALAHADEFIGELDVKKNSNMGDLKVVEISVGILLAYAQVHATLATVAQPPPA